MICSESFIIHNSDFLLVVEPMAKYHAGAERKKRSRSG